MSLYIKLSTLEFPRYEGDIRIEYPNISSDLTGSDFPCPEAYAKVTQLDEPTYSLETQYIQFAQPQNQNGQWTVGYEIHDFTAEQIANNKAIEMGMKPLTKPGKKPNVIS